MTQLARSHEPFLAIPHSFIRTDQPLSPTAQVVFLHLADRADEHGYCYPSLKRLAFECGVKSTHTIIKGINELVDRGYITKETRHLENGGSTSNRYYVTPYAVDDDEAKTARRGRKDYTPTTQNVHAPSAKSAHKEEPSEEEPFKENQLSIPLTPQGGMSDSPIIDIPINQPTEPTYTPTADEYSQSFENWWAVYPKHEAKRTAYRAYKAARKRTTDMVLLAGAQKYAADPNREAAYTKNASTWLNGDCWNDKPLPPRQSGYRNKAQERYDANQQRYLKAKAEEQQQTSTLNAIDLRKW